MSPGSIETDPRGFYAARKLWHDHAAAVKQSVAVTPARRARRVEDVAGLVAYLLSDAAGFLTGQTIVLGGGLTIVSALQHLNRAFRT